MQPISVTVGPLASSSANSIATAQTITGGGYLTLTSSTVTLPAARRITVTSSGNDTGITFTITGTTYSGQSVSQTITGGNGAAATTTIDFLTVTSIYASGTTAGDVTAGTSDIAGSRWISLDAFAPAPVGIQVDVTGTVNYTVQQTFDDPNDPFAPVALTSVNWVSSSDTAVVGQTATKVSNFAYAPKYIRLVVNSGPGTATMKVIQYSNGPI